LTEKLDKNNKILGLLGLAAKAGDIIFGTENIINLIRANKINFRSGLVLIANNTAERTKREICIIAKEFNVPCAGIEVSTEELGHRTGAKGSAAAVAVKNKNLTSALKKLI